MTYTNLELASMGKVPLADELLGSWEIVPNPHSTSQAERSAALVDLGFGKRFSDHMAHATWTAERGWHDFRIEPYEAIAMSPAGAVLHYGQEVFEGLKAYRHADGSIWTFRPTYNAARLNHSSRRLAIPEFEHEAFIGSIVNLVRQDAAWVPDAPGSSLYLRPFIFASEAFLGVRASHRYEYMVVASPSGAYFANGFQPIDVWVEREFHRAGTGGMGDAKTGGNYASSLLPKTVAHDAGYDEVMFLDATMGTDIDELGGMNVFVVMSDGSIRTPRLTGNILAGCTRSSILQLLRDEGRDVREETLPIADVLAGIDSGAVTEMFACGTAAVVTSIGSLSSRDFHVDLPGHETTKGIYDHLTGIQLGMVEDTHGWLYRLA